MFRKGMTDSEIAHALDCSCLTVKSIRCRLGLYRSLVPKYNKAAYELRRQGLKWSEINIKLNRPNMCSSAKKYALVRGLQWPIPVGCNKS